TMRCLTSTPRWSLPMAIFIIDNSCNACRRRWERADRRRVDRRLVFSGADRLLTLPILDAEGPVVSSARPVKRKARRHGPVLLPHRARHRSAAFVTIAGQAPGRFLHLHPQQERAELRHVEA